MGKGYSDDVGGGVVVAMVSIVLFLLTVYLAQDSFSSKAITEIVAVIVMMITGIIPFAVFPFVAPQDCIASRNTSDLSVAISRLYAMELLLRKNNTPMLLKFMRTGLYVSLECGREKGLWRCINLQLCYWDL